MENSSFVPNPLSAPALMALASSAEGREAPRLPAPPHPFSGPTLDKEMPTAPGPFSSAGFVYRHGDLIPSPLYTPMPPYAQPTLDRGIGLMGPSGGAFRHLGPHEGTEPYHSAFTPAKKKAKEDMSCTSTFSSENREQEKAAVEANSSLSPGTKEERPCSISSTGDANSEILSDNGDFCDRGTPDSEGRALRRPRKRTADGHMQCCPVCGLTVRPGEMENHLAVETEKLDRIFRGPRKSKDCIPSGKKTLPSTSGKKGKDSPSPESGQRYETFLRSRCNRLSRLNARSRNKKRKVGEEMVCPVCSERMTATAEELTIHVDQCLKKQRPAEEEEETLDVEGDGEGEQYEEYTWAGQTRIRASTMLEGGFASSGFQTTNSKIKSEDEGDLDVDGDDSEEYGKPQETDLIPLIADEPAEDKERQALRGALLGGAEQATVQDKSCLEEPAPGTSQTDIKLDSCDSDSASGAGQDVLLVALKARLKELESSKESRQKCLICMNLYQEPLVSIQCWHVHCQQCWFHTLGAKKLCPQCNMITSPSDLRRIYL